MILSLLERMPNRHWRARQKIIIYDDNNDNLRSNQHPRALILTRIRLFEPTKICKNDLSCSKELIQRQRDINY